MWLVGKSAHLYLIRHDPLVHSVCPLKTLYGEGATRGRGDRGSLGLIFLPRVGEGRWWGAVGDS